MTSHTFTPAAVRPTSGYAAARFVVRVGADWSPIRAATVWPIADVLEAGADLGAALPAAQAAAGDEALLVLDLVDSGMIAPPRPRRRRERPVSSRAVFYQAADA